ncbi:glutamate ligase domain-containing protein [Exilibacterium tricleocarpae]|uniref:glutamate ligase domain-containing protein n=1 Tax=Exilibacterium tricleocarpae TaxID=2591008 RepID=UPI001C550F88|nr:bifunctional tetrahydrofolate synthase/dihydrofolate synthase [Exilibacterium tricleocarpae]
MRFTSLRAWLDWLEQLHPAAIELGLDRIGKVAQALGVLQVAPTVITVAGTNGKGSCVAAMEQLLLDAGYRVGAYTSPHLEHYCERIRVQGQAVSEAAVCAAFARIDAARGDTSLTYFEFGTLAAMAIFLAQSDTLDVILLEVGLGGRLDAVNLWDADVAVITSIALDHQAWLGNDRETIGREKAGVLRAGRPAICADPQPPASIAAVAADKGAELLSIGREFACWTGTGSFSGTGTGSHGDSHGTGSHGTGAVGTGTAGTGGDTGSGTGTYTAGTGTDTGTGIGGAGGGAGTGTAGSGTGTGNWCFSGRGPAGEVVRFDDLALPGLPLPSVAAGLQALLCAGIALPEARVRTVVPRLSLRGRLQSLTFRGIDILLDVAHNPAAAAYLQRQLRQRPVPGATYAVAAMMADKDLEGTLGALTEQVAAWFVGGLAGVARAASAAQLQQALTRLSARVSACDTVAEAFDRAVAAAGPGDRVLVIGSFLTVAAVLAQCRKGEA